jgi:hypothetical protein
MEQLHSPVKGTALLCPSPINFVYVGYLFEETAHNVSSPFSYLYGHRRWEESKWFWQDSCLFCTVISLQIFVDMMDTFANGIS